MRYRLVDCLRVAAMLPAAGILLAGVARADVMITVDKSTQQMTVMVDGDLRWTWPVSTGIARYDTPNGSYTTFRMEKDHFSKEWDDAPMPYSIFFTQKGHAIHGSYHSRLGHAASHGCVRLAPKNAAKLFAVVKAEGLSKTHVVITGELPDAPLIAKRAPDGTPIVAAPEPGSGFAVLPRSAPRADITGAIRRPAAPPPQEADDYAMRARAAIARERQREAGQEIDAQPPVVRAPATVPAPRRYATRPRPDVIPDDDDAPPRAARSRRSGGPFDWRNPHVYYDPYVTVVEEYYVNGRLVRHSYRRRARSSDYDGFR